VPIDSYRTDILYLLNSPIQFIDGFESSFPGGIPFATFQFQQIGLKKANRSKGRDAKLMA